MVQKVTTTLKIDLSDIKGSNKVARKAEAMDEIGEFLTQSILSHVGSAKTPVKGGSYKKSLSKDYKKIKKKISGSSVANMELFGDMLDALEFKATGNRLEIGFLKGSDQTQIDKADNHNKFSAKAKKTKLPERAFIPKDGQTFKKTIMKEIQDIVSEHASEDN